MKYVIDHDYHIHSQISLCSDDPEQTTERILAYAKHCGLSTICLTDHYWDETVPTDLMMDFYRVQDTAHIRQVLPLPQADGHRFLFGCETDMDLHGTVGVAPEHFNNFDFVIIPTTHLHMMGFTLTPEQGASPERRARLWSERFDHLLDLPLPFQKIGIAHLTCSLIDNTSHEEYLRTLQLIPDEDMERLFTRAAAVGAGIELNSDDMRFSDEEADIVLRPYRIAKSCGCKFYLGSDAHHPMWLEGSIPVFQRAIDLLDLQETDKFHISGLS